MMQLIEQQAHLWELNQAKDQLSLQQITIETIRIDSTEEFEPAPAAANHSCGCGHGGCGSWSPTLQTPS